MSGLAIREIGLRHEAGDVLLGVSLTAAPGKLAALLGPAGSGKTALLRAVAGLETPHSGSIRIGDATVFDAAQAIDVPAESRGVGFMFQSAALWPRWTVAENLAFCARPQFAKAEITARVVETLAEVGIGELAERRSAQLSLAERQRVALARALVCRPKLLLLDDPLAGLVDDLRAQSRIWLRQLIGKTGTTALLATRDRTEALALADRIALINGGVIEQEATPSDLYAQPATPFAAAFMGAGNRIEGTLLEKAGPRAFIEVMGARFGGLARTQAAVGDTVTAMIRAERVMLGGGPGANRLAMKLASQAYLGERWELTFVKDALTVRAHATAPLKHEFYHVEFPPEALWIF